MKLKLITVILTGLMQAQIVFATPIRGPIETCTKGSESSFVKVTLVRVQGKSVPHITATVFRGGSLVLQQMVKPLGKESPFLRTQYVAIDALGNPVLDSDGRDYFSVTIHPGQGAKGSYSLHGNTVADLICNPVVF